MDVKLSKFEAQAIESLAEAILMIGAGRLKEAWSCCEYAGYCIEDEIEERTRSTPR